MSQPSDKVNPFDPLGFWRTSQDATLDAWSKAMIDLVNSEAYSEATARLLDTYLSVSAPARKLLSQTMAQVLTQLNMPTEAEVTGLAERLTNIEMRPDDLDARLDTVVRALDALASAAARTPSAPTSDTPASRGRVAARPASPRTGNGATGRAVAPATPSRRGRGGDAGVATTPQAGASSATPSRRTQGASSASATPSPRRARGPGGEDSPRRRTRANTGASPATNP